MLEEPAEARLAADLAEPDGRRRRLVALLRPDQPIAEPLMGPALVIIADEFPNQIVAWLQKPRSVRSRVRPGNSGARQPPAAVRKPRISNIYILNTLIPG